MIRKFLDWSTIEVTGDLLGGERILFIAAAGIVHFRFCFISCLIGAHACVHELGGIEDLGVYDLLAKILLE